MFRSLSVLLVLALLLGLVTPAHAGHCGVGSFSYGHRSAAVVAPSYFAQTVVAAPVVTQAVVVSAPAALVAAPVVQTQAVVAPVTASVVQTQAVVAAVSAPVVAPVVLASVATPYTPSFYGQSAAIVLPVSVHDHFRFRHSGRRR